MLLHETKAHCQCDGWLDKCRCPCGQTCHFHIGVHTSHAMASSEAVYTTKLPNRKGFVCLTAADILLSAAGETCCFLFQDHECPAFVGSPVGFRVRHPTPPPSIFGPHDSSSSSALAPPPLLHRTPSISPSFFLGGGPPSRCSVTKMRCATSAWVIVAPWPSSRHC